MGKLEWKEDGWCIAGTDRIKEGDRVEIRQPDGSWKEVTIGKDFHEISHSEPSGPGLTSDTEVRRPQSANFKAAPKFKTGDWVYVLTGNGKKQGIIAEAIQVQGDFLGQYLVDCGNDECVQISEKQLAPRI